MPTNQYLKLLHGLLARLPGDHPAVESITDELRLVDAGLFGEAYIADVLAEHGYTVLRDLYIHQQQMDLVVITESALVVIEVKNIRGKVVFTSAPRQLIRKQENGEIDIFTSPFVQLENGVRVLQQLLGRYPYNLPVYGVVCFPFQSAFITGDTGDFPVLMGRDVLNFLGRLNHGEPILSARQIKSVISLLKKSSQPFVRPILCHKFKIEVSDLKKGCRCTRCSFVGMSRQYAMWFCPSCRSTSRDAHHLALLEYANFVSEEITIREAMEYLGVHNRNTIRRILETAGAIRSGTTRSVKYKLKRF